MVDDNIDQFKVTPALVAYACPDLSIGMFGENPSWDDILAAAHVHKRTLGVSDSIWGEACRGFLADLASLLRWQSFPRSDGI